MLNKTDFGARFLNDLIMLMRFARRVNTIARIFLYIYLYVCIAVRNLENELNLSMQWQTVVCEGRVIAMKWTESIRVAVAA